MFDQIRTMTLSCVFIANWVYVFFTDIEQVHEMIAIEKSFSALL